MNLSNDEKFLLLDIKNNHSQSSWDWQADKRFCLHLGEDHNIIDHAINSDAPSSFRVAASKSWEKITRKRMRTLNALVKKGLVESSWVGTGFGGKSSFGVSRLRSYSLNKKGFNRSSELASITGNVVL